MARTNKKNDATRAALAWEAAEDRALKAQIQGRVRRSRIARLLRLASPSLALLWVIS